MGVKVGRRWSGVIAEAIKSGRYATVEDVVAEGLRHVAEEEARFRWLKDERDRAIARGGSNTADEAAVAIDDALADTH